MKKFTLFLSLLCFAFLFSAEAQVNYTAQDQVTPYNGRFRAGVNFGYYPLWGNQQQADVAAGNPVTNQTGVGARSIRQGMYENPLDIFGYDLLVADFGHFNNLNMSNGEAVAIVGGPLEWHRDLTNYCPSDPTKLSKFFGNMYTPIWDGGLNGTPYNDDNYFAAYLHKVVTQYKDDVRFWEVWNEPGLDYGACGWRAPGDPICNWWDRDPSPCELDLGAPIEHYVRALRIAWEIIKTVDPDSYVCLGSMGYQAGLDAVLRNTDNPVDGSPTPDHPLYGGAYFDCVTMHNYPHFDGSTVNFSGGFFERHSDRAADGVFLFRDTYQGILNNYGFNGVQYPKKEFISTELNAPRHSYPAGVHFAGEVAQRNYLQKVYMVAKIEKIGSMHVYQLFDRKTPQEAGYEFDEMGMYKTIESGGTNTIGPFGQQVNDQGIAFKTISDIIFPTDYDPIETAKMGLSTTSPVRGYAFKRPDGQYVYALWARTQTDLSEVANATYSFPASMGLTSLVRHEWNWGYTGNTTNVSPNNIALTATPLYFVGGTATQTCAISASVTEVACNNNGTPTDPNDDTFSYTLSVSSNGNCSSGWNITSGGSGSGSYGLAQTFGPFPISGGNQVITIQDNVDATATTTLTVFAPATCSGGGNPCTISASASNVVCNDNGTPNNSADDTYTFDVTVNKTASCTSTQWQTGSTTGAYGIATSFGPYAISGGNQNLTITALGQSPTVNTSVQVVAPAPCSGGNTGGTCTNNVLANSGFESGLNSWNQGTGVSAVGGGYNGSAGAAQLCDNGQRIYQTVQGTPGSYTFQAYAHSVGVPSTATLAIKFLDSGWSPLLQDFAPVAASTNYSLFSITSIAPSGTAWVEISVLKETGTACLVIDDLCLGTTGGGTDPTVTINCPQNISVTAASGATSAVVNYSMPTATAMNCNTAPNVTLTSGLASGASFPLGTTNVVYSATCGTATSSCLFSVTVNTGSTGGGCSNNLLTNGSFENANPFSSWNVGSGVTSVGGGAAGTSTAAQLCENSERIYLTQAATAGETYAVELMAKNNGSAAAGFISIKFLDNSWTPLNSEFGNISSVTSTYKNFTATEPAPPGSAYVEISVWKQSGAGCLIVDEICLSDGGGSGGCTLNAVVSNILCYNNGTDTNPNDDTFTFDVTVNANGTCGTSYTTSGSLGGFGTFGVSQSYGPVAISGGALNLTFTDTGNTANQTSTTITPPSTCSNGGGGNGTDLELTLSTPNMNPGIWKNADLTLTIENKGTIAVSGVEVDFLAQSNMATSDILAYVSHNADVGTSFEAWFGVWTVGTLAAGESKTLTYNGFTKSANAIPVFGQVSAQSPLDSDSAPDNNVSGIPAEDDEAALTLNGTAPQPFVAGNAERRADMELIDYAVFPNPARDIVSLNLESYLGTSTEVRILNQYGRTVMSQKIDKLQTPLVEFNLNTISNGVYMITVHAPGMRGVVKKLTVARLY